jgi:hypothetical protein
LGVVIVVVVVECESKDKNKTVQRKGPPEIIISKRGIRRPKAFTKKNSKNSRN